MANMLAAFGRSGFMGKASGMLQSISAYKQGESRIALNEEQLAQEKRENQIAKAEEARLSAKIDLQLKFEQFPGGKDGPIAQGAASFFKRRGLVDMELGAMGQVTQRAMDEFEEWIKTNPMEVSQSVVKHLQVEYAKRDDINAQLKEKEGDKKLLEALQNVNLSIQQATEWVAGIKAETTRQAEVEKAATLATAKKEAEAKKSRELRVRQIAERLIKEQTATTPTKIMGNVLFKWLGKKTLDSKEQKLLDKYLRDTKQTTQEAYDKTRQRLKAKVDEFEALVKRKATVGEIRRMFFADIYGILEPEEETPSSVEGKAVPERLKDESLEDYLKRVSE